MRAALDACRQRGDTELAVVSGRGLEDLRKTLGRSDLVLIGNHGLEIEGPELPRFVHPDTPHFEARLWDLARALSATYAFKGERLWVQDNKRLGCWGWPSEFVTNVHHHYCLVFKNEP